MKGKIDPWKKLVIIEIIVISFLIINLIFGSDEFNPTPKEMCERAEVVPSWMSEGQVINKGYKGKPGEGVIDSLIQEEVYFIYSSECSYCQKQIEDFGEEWLKYKDAGLTVDCSKQ